jgi:hypothetical protein
MQLRLVLRSIRQPNAGAEPAQPPTQAPLALHEGVASTSRVSISINLFRLKFELASKEDVEPGHGVSRLMRLIPEINGE